MALFQLNTIRIRPLFVSHVCVNNKLYVKNKNKCLLFSELNRCLKKKQSCMSMMNMVNPLLVKFSLKSAKYSFSNKYIVCFELAKSTFNLKWWNYTAEPEIELIVRGGWRNPNSFNSTVEPVILCHILQMPSFFKTFLIKGMCCCNNSMFF